LHEIIAWRSRNQRVRPPGRRLGRQRTRFVDDVRDSAGARLAAKALAPASRLGSGRSGATIEALITIWRAPGPSVPRKAIVSLFGRDKVCVQRWLYRVPRLRGAAALQVRNDSSASAQANSTSLVRGLARIGIDSRKSKLVRNCVMHRNKYLTFLHRVGYDGGYRYLPATRCY